MAETAPVDAPRSRRPTFDPTFNLGHLLTATVIVLGLIGGVITMKDGLRDGLAEMRSDNKVQDSRIEGVAREVARSQTEDVTFRSEVRQSLTQLSGAIADLRVLFAASTAPATPGRH